MSTDGSNTGNTLTDTAANTLNYYYGADGADTLNGSNDRDVLNGGGGVDNLNGGGGNDILIYDGANNDVINGGTGFDILRIDDGALQLSQAGSGLSNNTLGPANNVLVNLTGKAITNIEAILITEEAGASTAGIDINDDVGTTLNITAADILAYSDTDTLWILGNPGDVVQLGSASDWIDKSAAPGVQGTPFAGTGGQTFTLFESHTGALVYIESEVQAKFNP